MRINKYLSHNTKYSRREADELIKEGKVKVNHKIVEDMSTNVTKEDRVYIGKKSILPKSKYTVIFYNKNRGELCTKKDPQNRKTIFHTLAKKFEHFITVGRLDFLSEGLIMLTDAPDIADNLMRSDIPRIYNIKIDGPVSESMIEGMKDGVLIEDTKGAHKDTHITSMQIEPFSFFEIKTNGLKFSKLKVCITEGKNRELRRFFAHYGRVVMDLKRVQFGEFTLNNLPSGKSRYLTNDEYDALRDMVGLKNKKKKKDNK